jgi:hypothetical protein
VVVDSAAAVVVRVDSGTEDGSGVGGKVRVRREVTQEGGMESHEVADACVGGQWSRVDGVFESLKWRSGAHGGVDGVRSVTSISQQD